MSEEEHKLDRSVNCYFCNELSSDSECIPADEYNDNDGGSICPRCVEIEEEGLAQQEPNLWSVNLNTTFKNVLFDCAEDELEENVRTFVVSELENLDWTYEKADVNVSKTMIRS